jgi:hypothetical protein
MNTNIEINIHEEFYRDGLEALSAGIFDLFEAKYKTTNDKKAQRILNHLKIKSLMATGEFKEAINKTKKTRLQFGDHIGLVCDLASLYYLTNQYSLWGQCLEELEAILSANQGALATESYAKSILLLAKFQEEQGAISKAYSSLQMLGGKTFDSLKLRIHANLLRLDAFYKISNNVSTYYYEIKQSLNSDLGYNTSPEIAHALILGELDIFGIEELEKNLLKLSKSDMLQDDLLLIMIDMALLLSQRDLAVPIWLSDKLKNFSSSNLFEQKLIDYMTNNPNFSEDWIQWPTQMPLGNFFQLSKLLEKRLTSTQNKTLQKQLILLTKQLPVADQKYWRRFSSDQNDSRLTINHQQDDRSIKIEDISISLKNKKILFEVLVLVSREKKVMLSSISKNIFHSEFNESYYHRIRRLVKRINDEFEAKLLPPPISCDKNHLLLCKKYL